ncbi:TetR/AcrR family transcriptional regulator [Streptomyces mutabilis]|uniref:TetR/AcrR family transcriptional regulator n=1 Tax=Streptomyces mutabilis TaxID=67332 RepID=UPI0019883ABF|nr:hypothetical protein [Streptomyces mutabilis]GGQ19648.1 hypothetical protein GCM10010279_29320 [Streptomyces mutabilis]
MVVHFSAVDSSGYRDLQENPPVIEIICGKVRGTDRNLLLSYELHAFATRNPEVRAVMRSGMQASRDSLARHFDSLTARALDALVEGFSIHNSFDLRPTEREEVAAVVRAVVDRHH